MLHFEDIAAVATIYKYYYLYFIKNLLRKHHIIIKRNFDLKSRLIIIYYLLYGLRYQS